MNGYEGHCPHCGIEVSVADNVPCGQCDYKRIEFLKLAKSISPDRLDEAIGLLNSIRRTGKGSAPGAYRTR